MCIRDRAYVHRIGRTGRNGRKGQAISLFTEEDSVLLPAILKVARASGAEVPEWAMKLKGAGRRDVVKRLEKRPPARKRVGGPNRASLRKRHKSEQQMARRKERKAEKQSQLKAEQRDTIVENNTDEGEGTTEFEASGNEDERNVSASKKRKRKKRKSRNVTVEVTDD